MKRRLVLPVFPGMSDLWFQPDADTLASCVRSALTDLVGPFEDDFWLHRLVLGMACFDSEAYRQKASDWLVTVIGRRLRSVLPAIQDITDPTYEKGKQQRIEADIHFTSLRELMADVNSVLKDHQSSWNAHLEMNRKTNRRVVQPLLAAGAPPYSPIGLTDNTLSFMLDCIARTILSGDDLRQMFISDFYARSAPGALDLFPVSAIGDDTRAQVDHIIGWVRLKPPTSLVRRGLEDIFAFKK